MTQRTYTVPAMHCDHCRSSIESEVSRVPGVEAVTVDLASKTVRVDGDASPDAIREAIDEAGYEVKAVTGA